MKPQLKRVKKPIHGVLLLNKPKGISSNAALQKARTLYQAAKGGHTGALDPMATGLLPLCFGEATKFSHYLLDADKTYQATLHLGTKTDSGDADGQVIAQQNVPLLNEATIQQVMMCLLGAQQQIPPMYSALKHQGQALYHLARQGVEVERAPRLITIHALSLLSFSQHDIVFKVTCSKGTYVRTLAETLAEKLGTVGHLTALHRLQTGHFELQAHMTLDYLTALDEAARMACLLPVHAPVALLPRVVVDQHAAADFKMGRALAWASVQQLAQTQNAAMLPPLQPLIGVDFLVFTAQNICLGLAVLNDQGCIQPKRGLNLLE